VAAFLDGLSDEKRRQDSYVIMELMKKITGFEPKMWGDAIIGYGSLHYKYESGREGDMPLTGFSPRKQTSPCISRQDLTGSRICWTGWESINSAKYVSTSKNFLMWICRSWKS
jgi:hypothetical protein